MGTIITTTTITSMGMDTAMSDSAFNNNTSTEIAR
jgi:hypothetical protein